MENFELRQFDIPLLRFSAEDNSRDPEIRITWVNEEKKYLLPLDLQLSTEGLLKWLKHRTIPGNRAYVRNFLSKCGLSLNRPLGIIKVSKGLSLNDCYWVTEEGFKGTFAEYNLYDHRFSRILGLIAFTGYGSSQRTSLASSPEFTTNGMLPKCWRRIKGRVYLFKGGTSGASNTGKEPFSEFYASQIAEVMEFRAVPYGISNWKGTICSTCELFTSHEYAYLPIGRLVRSGGMEAVREKYRELGDEYLRALHDMLILDALICNTDRHFGNFGLMVDTAQNKIVAPAPLFDHGNSLFNYATEQDMEDEETFREYVDTLLPCVYDDFIGTAKEVLEPRHHAGLRKLLTFRFKRHSRYNLPKERLKVLEEEIHRRARLLLE